MSKVVHTCVRVRDIAELAELTAAALANADRLLARSDGTDTDLGAALDEPA